MPRMRGVVGLRRWRGAGSARGALASWRARLEGRPEGAALGGGGGALGGVGVGEADVRGGEDDEAAGDEEGVLAAFQHAGEPVEGGVGVGAAEGLDEGGGDVVVPVAGAVVEGGAVLEGLLDVGEGDLDSGALRLARRRGGARGGGRGGGGGG